MKLPPIPEDQTEVELTFDSVDLTCRGYFSPPERGSFEDGLQMEPDEPACFEMDAAYVEGRNIFEMLSAKVIEQLQSEAATKLSVKELYEA